MTRRALPWLVLGLILAGTAATYRGVVEHDFVLDDKHTVRDNPSIRSLTLAGQWLSSPYAVSGARGNQNYRPVLMASYAVDYALWGEGPSGFHVTNLLIHGGVVFLAFVLGRRLWGHDGAGVIAAGVVALHPVNAEVVNYVTARSSSLMALFVLGAVWAYDRAVVEGRRAWAVMACGLGLLAMGTKESAVVLPVLIMAWDRARGTGSEAWRATLRRSVPWWVVVAGFLAVRMWVLSWGYTTAVQGMGATGSQALLFIMKIYLVSVGHWFWPVGLAVDHAWPFTIGLPEGVLLAAGAAGAVGGTIVAARLDRRVGWCLVWFWAALAPAGLLPFVSRFTLYQDNRVYLAGIALAWIAGWAIVRASRWLVVSPPLRAAGTVMVVVVVVIAVRADLARTAMWADSIRLWSDVLEKYPESSLAHNGMGLLSMEAGRLDEARRSFETALALNPLHAAAALNLGRVYEHTGRPDLALDVYDRLVRDDPHMTAALARSGILLERQGRLDEAQERYRRVLTIDPTDDQASLALGGVLLRLGRWADARTVFEALANRRPVLYAARFNFGVSLEHLGRTAEALDAYRAAASLQPRDPDPYFRIAVIYSKEGQWEAAADWYRRSLARDPRHFLSHMNLARVAERIGDAAEAMRHYQAVLSTAPDEPTDDSLRAQAREALRRLGLSVDRPGAAGSGSEG